MLEVKLFIADLEHGLDKQLFEISSESFIDQAVMFAEERIICSLTSEKQWHGYRLTGDLTIPFFKTCDCCLDEFTDQHTTQFIIILTNDAELSGEEDDDVICFGDADNTVDIGPVIRELVLVEESLKNICRADCKGICQYCGTNRNRENCGCNANTIVEDRWENLKQIIK
ncbi:MAG: DUF177 domain-containing protein [Candidatus Neomarinimicrobiota bacterium]|nr:DUF177 domain-containing protein [Candidatus Neomarinimicrobiota bacterium]